MRCDEIAAMGFGAFCEAELPPAELSRLTEHLAHCADCRTEAAALRGLAQRLAREARAESVAAPGVTGTADDRGARRREQLLEAWQIGRAERRSGAPLMPLAAAVLLGLAMGLLSPWRPWTSRAGDLRPPSAPGPVEPVGGESRQVLLALHERPGSIGGDPEQRQSVIREYGDWAGGLAAASQLVAAEKLRDDADLLLRRDGDGIAITSPGPEDSVPSDERLSGFFVVRARDLDHAIELARVSPHLRHGGTIALREIEATR